MFDEEFANLPGPGLLLASGDNVGASPANSGLLQDKPAIDVENAWGLDATSLGNHEFDYGIDRLKSHIARADFPFLASNVVETATGQIPDWLDGASKVFTINGTRVGVIGAELAQTPELVSAGATAGLSFLDEGPRIKAESNRLKAMGVKVQVVVIHQGTANGRNPIGNAPGQAWDGPILAIADQLQDTTVDAMLVGHTHRISNLQYGKFPILEGYNAGASYSVLQLMVQGGDVTWAGGATRVAKNIGVAADPIVKAIVDDANAQTAVLRNQVIGTQQFDIKRAPTRLFESAMGNMVADAMREKYPGVEAAYTNSGGLRQDLNCSPPSAGEQPCEITWGEMFSVLPFGNRTVIETLTGAQMETAFLNGFAPFCDPAFTGGTGRFPQISGLKVTVRLQRDRPRSSRACGRPQRGSPDRQRPSGRPTASGSSPTTSCTRAATATPSSPRAPTSCSRATTCCRSPSTTWPRTRRSDRWWRAGSPVPDRTKPTIQPTEAGPRARPRQFPPIIVA